MPSPLREPQLRAVYRAADRFQHGGKGFYDAWEPGTGKCLLGITTARAINAKRVAILCPPVAIGVWQRELLKWWPSYDPMQTFICGFERLVVPTASDNRGTTNRRRNAQRALESMKALKPDLLIVDEAHHAKSPSSKVTRAVWKMADVSAHALYLSGTQAHDPLDYWAQYRIVDAPNWKGRFSDYRREVAFLEGPNENWVAGWRTEAVETRKALMAPVTDYFPISELGVPEPVETVVPFKLDWGERADYDKMANDLVLELRNGHVAEAELEITRMLRLHQITSGHITDNVGITNEVGHSKLDVVMQLIDERPRYKIVVACRFTPEMQRLVQRLLTGGRRVLEIRGGMTAEHKAEVARTFREDPDPIVCLIQYQAGGESEDFSAAQTMILYSLDSSTIRYRQMLGRSYRYGQQTNLQVLIPCAENSIDEEIFRGLRDNLDTIALRDKLKGAIL